MLLQITNIETIDSLSTIGSDNGNTGLFLIIGLIAIGLILYFILRPKKKDEIENKHKESTRLNDRQELIVTDKKKEKKLEVSEPQNETKRKEQQHTPNTSTTKVEKKQANKTKQTNNEPVTQIKKAEVVIPEKEEQSKEKYIGYNPINIFAQTEPFNFPYVLMPRPNSVIKFPRKGRSGRKGFKEEEFKTYVAKYFKGHYQVFDDRFILVKNSHNPYEPDFTLIDERDGINIFLDVEIDEPYEGLNDIQKRKPTHFQNSDINRNNALELFRDN